MGMRTPKGFALPPGVPSLGINLEAFASAAPARAEVKAAPPAPRLVHEVGLPGWVPPALNRLMRGKVRDRISLGRDCDDRVALACRAAGVPPAAGKRRVTLVLGLPPGRTACDVDAPFKAVLDALVTAGALRGDTIEWCELAPIRAYPRAELLTTIILEELEPEHAG